MCLGAEDTITAYSYSKYIKKTTTEVLIWTKIKGLE